MNFWLKIFAVLCAIIYSELDASQTADFVIAGILILVFGIPHGASDPIIYNYVKNRDINQQPPPKFILIYVSSILGYLTLWIIFPLPSFIFFLVISAYHFGEAQFIKSGKANFKKSTAMIWGCAVLLLLFLPHTEILRSWLLPIVDNTTVFSWLSDNKQIISIVAIIAILGSIAVLNKKLLVKEFIELTALLILFNHSSILISFAIFFTVWHSHDSLQLQFTGLKKRNRSFSFLDFIKKLSPLSAMSILFLILFTYIAYSMQLEISWVISFFILVALITLPHSLIIHNFYRTSPLD